MIILGYGDKLPARSRLVKSSEKESAEALESVLERETVFASANCRELIASITKPIPSVKNGITITDAQLKELFPEVANDAVIARAREILGGIVPNNITFAECARWGSAVEHCYSAFVDKLLQLAGTSVSIDATKNHTDLHRALKEIAEPTHTESRSFWLFSIDTSIVDETAILKRLKNSREKIDSLCSNLRNGFDALTALRIAYEDIIDAGSVITEQYNAYAIAGQYLAEHIIVSKDSVRYEQLMQKTVSLTQMMLEIGNRAKIRRTHAHAVGALANKIHETVFAIMPTLLDDIALLSSQDVAKTDLEKIQNDLWGAIKSIKPETGASHAQ